MGMMELVDTQDFSAVTTVNKKAVISDVRNTIMGFMQSYKRLDVLCRDMNGIGVTGYIEDMERAVNGAHYISGWHSDYQKLKHYRYIRNQIAHEVYATEESMCSSEDIVWIEEFYQRILERTDPLAAHYKRVSQLQKTAVSSAKNLPNTSQHGASSARQTPKNNAPNFAAALIIGIIVFVAMLVFYR